MKRQSQRRKQPQQKATWLPFQSHQSRQQSPICLVLTGLLSSCLVALGRLWVQPWLELKLG
jgi:hypothetical protein